ncbi:2-hydroxyacid dehydrogenase [Spiribacter vilamensis]|uniref:D-lactate dehydrogenase n=1 Tax=Spiribacter vilamensis TaxID=531306 RepID=A0A4Q8D066_9GAMM|nr:2-hydroxyacid dehydrogenase [Spiribacter vilamensis]RZU98688.1 D-lactate dehydrogenase [Spiribacter vilamensis]TVO62286.1 2-hydroxyacid dehydrogenase [Spiribacter vilamensis]
MRIYFFSAQKYDREFMERGNENHGFELAFTESPLNADTARLANGAEVICAFVNDTLDAPCLQALADAGVRIVAMRCAGFNNVDVPEAKRLGLSVVTVPAYSPEAVAEHTLALILTLNRNTHRAYARVREGDFNLKGLLGFNLNGRTVGLVGTGRIGVATARVLSGLGVQLLGFDVYENPAFEALGGRYVELDDLYAQSDIISLHCPLTDANHYMINATSIARMKDGVMLVNTSRGGLIDTEAVIEALKSRKVGHLALDVYEQESDIFFRDLSDEILADDMLSRLLTFPNVLITGHQGFFTEEAMTQIAEVTLANVAAVAGNEPCDNELTRRL